MTLFGARMASKGLWAGGDAMGWKLRLRASGGQVRGKFVAGGCMTTSSHGLGLFFENFFEGLGVENAFSPAVQLFRCGIAQALLHADVEGI